MGKPKQPENQAAAPVLIDNEGNVIEIHEKMRYVGEYKGFQAFEWCGIEDQHELHMYGYVPNPEKEGTFLRQCLHADNMPIGYKTTPPYDNLWDCLKAEIDQYIANKDSFVPA